MTDILERKGSICWEYATAVLRKNRYAEYQGQMSLYEAKNELFGTEHLVGADRIQGEYFRKRKQTECTKAATWTSDLRADLTF